MSLSTFGCPALAPVYRAFATKSFEMCLEQAAAVMSSSHRQMGSEKPCVGSEPFRMLVARAQRGGILFDAKNWRALRDWRNESVHRYTDEAAIRILAGMSAFIASARGLLGVVSACRGN